MPNILRKTIATTAVFTIALSSFMLVPRASEFSPYADTLAGVDVIDPQPSEAQYRFGDSITRAEVAKIVVKLRGQNPSGCQGNIYSDVTSALGDLCDYVEAAAKAGIISRAQSTFRPTEPVTRAELAKIIFSGAGINPSQTLAGFRDVPSSLGDLVGYINAGVELGCMKTGSTYSPSNESSRGETFKIAACAHAQKKTPAGPGAWKLVWADEFSGASLDPTKWNLETGSERWGNNELQNYTATGNAWVRSGLLTIEARKEKSGTAEYSSARLNTHKKISGSYGKIEGRIKLPTGQGIWPAFWMLGDDIDKKGYPESGEIDIVEMVGGKWKGGEDNELTIVGSVHRPNRDSANREDVKSTMTRYDSPTDTRFSDDFHVYAIEWDQSTVRHYVDGKLYGAADISKRTDGFDVFHKPYYIILNIAVWGDWPGPPDQTTVWPQRMEVDWVRVYQK